MVTTITTCTFQYFSDVHTEQYVTSPRKLGKLGITAMAPFLILGGDIGHPYSHVYSDFLEMLSPMFKHIFVVSGNHEYWVTPSIKRTYYDSGFYGGQYESWFQQVDDCIRYKVRSFGNITFLQNEVVDVPGVPGLKIFGGTFWSMIKKEEEEAVVKHVKDYYAIPGVRVEDVRKMHKEAYGTLGRVLDGLREDNKLIVVSHHLPSYSLIDPKYLDGEVNSAYASDLSKLSEDPRIVAWVAGHTHTGVEQGKFHVNPIGCIRENKVVDFNKTFVVDV